MRLLWNKPLTRRLLPAVLLAVAMLGAAAVPTQAASDVTVHSGQLAGARFRVEVPAGWNGTLLLYSHGAYSHEFPPGDEIALSNHWASREWLLDNGYALAAARYENHLGWLAVESGLRDQKAVLDWFETNVGKPRRTVSYGASAGGLVALLLAERNPRRFAGVAALCGATAGSLPVFNSALDMGFALKTLLAPGSGLDLVDIDDPATNVTKLREILDTAHESGDAKQLARLSLAAALGDIPARFSARAVPPPTVVDQVRHQYLTMYYNHAGYFGVTRTDIEQRAGGNVSWNAGVDYGRLFANSSQRALAERAYAAAGLDLDADLRRLNAAPRIKPDVSAAAYLARNGVPAGRTPWPVITMHNTDDGSVPVEHAAWYAEQVARHGKPANLRQVSVDRGSHCSFTAAEEITTLRTLLSRVDSGRWPDTSPSTMNTAAATYGPDFQTVFDYDPSPGFHPHVPSFAPNPGGSLQRPFPY